jgi:hypothetical protein
MSDVEISDKVWNFVKEAARDAAWCYKHGQLVIVASQNRDIACKVAIL